MEKEGNLNGNSKSDDENEKDSENEFDLYITEFNDILAVMLKDPNVFVLLPFYGSILMQVMNCVFYAFIYINKTNFEAYHKYIQKFLTTLPSLDYPVQLLMIDISFYDPFYVVSFIMCTNYISTSNSIILLMKILVYLSTSKNHKYRSFYGSINRRLDCILLLLVIKFLQTLDLAQIPINFLYQLYLLSYVCLSFHRVIFQSSKVSIVVKVMNVFMDLLPPSSYLYNYSIQRVLQFLNKYDSCPCFKTIETKRQPS